MRNLLNKIKLNILYFQRQIDVYHLSPNTTYIFRVWARNQLGKGEIVEVEGHTHHSVEELGITKRFFYEYLETRNASKKKK